MNKVAHDAMQRREILKALAYPLVGVLAAGMAVYVYLDHSWKRSSFIASREYNAAIAELSARALARLRTGSPEDAISFLEDRVDSYLAGVPMGKSYRELTYGCQHAMAIVKVYRSQFPFRGACTLHTEDLHAKHVPEMLDDVPLLSAEHEWLDPPMRKVARMQRSFPQPLINSAVPQERYSCNGRKTAKTGATGMIVTN